MKLSVKELCEMAARAAEDGYDDAWHAGMGASPTLLAFSSFRAVCAASSSMRRCSMPADMCVRVCVCFCSGDVPHL